MGHGWRTTGLALVAIAGLLGRPEARADIVLGGSFGPNGDLGFATSPPALSIAFGGSGQGNVVQMDGFLNVPGRDFGGGPGMSADLANGAPAGLNYTFVATQPTAHQLLLSYQFVNNSGSALTGLQFLQFTDADIGAAYPNDFATVHGPAHPSLPDPTSFQVGDPTYSTIFTNLGTGQLSNVNELAGSSSSTRGDVSIALGFSYGTLAIGQAVAFDVLLSDDGSSLGHFSVTQANPDFGGNALTISGTVIGAAVPEPSSLILLTVGLVSGMAYASRRRARAQAWTRSQ